MKDKFNSNWPLDIAELTASDIMVLRNKVELINIEWPKQRIKDVILNLTHSSIPVMQGSHNNFIGVVKINELYLAAVSGKKSWQNIQQNCHAAIGVLVTDSIDKIYKKMMEESEGLVNVIDQRREFVGIISLKDIYSLLNQQKYKFAKVRMRNRKYGYEIFKWVDQMPLKRNVDKEVNYMHSFNDIENIRSIRIIIRNGNIWQLHKELKKLTTQQISELLLQLDNNEQIKFWRMVPIH